MITDSARGTAHHTVPGVQPPITGVLRSVLDGLWSHARFRRSWTFSKVSRMLDHLAIQVGDVEAAAAFYVRVFAPLGFREAMRFQRGEGLVVGLGGADGFPHFWLGPTSAPAGREAHIAFTAPSRAAVDEVHAAAVDAGTEILHAPRVWPEYHPGYYGVFVRDPDGNNVEAVHHGF